MTEIPDNGIDDDCDPFTPAWGTPASVMGQESPSRSDVSNVLFFLIPPVGIVLILKRSKRMRQKAR
jgi:hypothetical protein